MKVVRGKARKAGIAKPATAQGKLLFVNTRNSLSSIEMPRKQKSEKGLLGKQKARERTRKNNRESSSFSASD